MSLLTVDNIEAELNRRGVWLRGITVAKNGETLFGHMWQEDVPYPIYSAAKTVTALGVGIAEEEGRFDISCPLSDYLPEEYLSEMDSRQREALSGLPVWRFMTMSVVGFPFRPSGNDWLRHTLSLSYCDNEKPRFDYTNVSAYLVGVACEYALGEPFGEYLRKRIFEPLGIPFDGGSTDPQGRFYGATGMNLRLGELAQLGQLMLDRGRGIVPARWIDEMTKKHIENDRGGYGYFVWTEPGRYYISGKLGQRSIVCPQSGTVITYMSDRAETAELMQPVTDSIFRELM